MAWSTRELADLADTTVNTIRHYHREGLLGQPDRLSNGYKQYGARHLMRLLQIRRLRDLGVPLARIEAVGFGEQPPAEALREIDAGLAASIARLERARAEIRAVLEGTAGTDVPAGFENLTAHLSAPERSLVLVYAQLYDESSMEDVKRMVAVTPDAADAAFEALPAEAAESTRQLLAEALAPQLARHLREYTWLADPTGRLPKGPRLTREAFLATIVEIYNEAQLDVLARTHALATALVAEDSREG